MSKLWTFMSNFSLFFYAYSPTMVMSRAQSCKFRILLSDLHLILGKVTKFLVEYLSISEIVSQKPLGLMNLVISSNISYFKDVHDQAVSRK